MFGLDNLCIVAKDFFNGLLWKGSLDNLRESSVFLSRLVLQNCESNVWRYIMELFPGMQVQKNGQELWVFCYVVSSTGCILYLNIVALSHDSSLVSLPTSHDTWIDPQSFLGVTC